LSQPFKICPICKTPAHRNAALCSTCGTTLTDVEVLTENGSRDTKKSDYDHRYGETDLFEGALTRKSEFVFAGAIVTLAVLVCIGTVLFLAPRIIGGLNSLRGVRPTATLIPTRGGPAEIVGTSFIVTNTPRPTLNFATVTPAPPTATASATQGPCIVQVQPGDDLISLAIGCGHHSMDVMPLILATNDLSAADAIQVGQELQIPWPTPTVDPNSVPTEAPTNESGDSAVVDPDRTQSGFDVALENSNAIATETLQPGVTWHRVVANENIITIAYSYGADIEVLSQLNPEVTFSQCDFGSPTGGDNCIVLLYEGQLIRVPAPTPVPTLSPTPNGSETATPTPTATFNAPSLTSPGNRSLFMAGDLITLRWVGTGTLGEGQLYHVEVEDTTAGVAYSADTREISMIVPEAWQGQDGQRHDYTWRVSVIATDRPDEPLFTTDRRIFTWEGRGD
jgi:hypothetical protein